MGDRSGQQGHQSRGRRVQRSQPRSLLREVAVVHAGSVPSRSSALLHEAHEPQRRGRPRLGAHHACRGVRRGGCQVQRDRGEVRRGSQLRHGRHLACVGAAAVRHAEVHLPHAERAPGLRDLQGPAPLRRHPHRRDRLAVDGGGAGPSGVRAVGHRVGVLELRLHEPYGGGLLAARLQAHPGGSPHDAAGQGSRRVAAAARGHRPVPVAGLAQVDPRQRGVRRRVRAPLDERPVLVEPREGRPHGEGLVHGNERRHRHGEPHPDRGRLRPRVDRPVLGLRGPLPALHLLGREQQQAYVLGCRGLPVGGREAQDPDDGHLDRASVQAHHRGRLAARPLQVRQSGRRAVRRLLGRGQRGRQALEPGRRCSPAAWR